MSRVGCGMSSADCRVVCALAIPTKGGRAFDSPRPGVCLVLSSEDRCLRTIVLIVPRPRLGSPCCFPLVVLLVPLDMQLPCVPTSSAGLVQLLSHVLCCPLKVLCETATLVILLRALGLLGRMAVDQSISPWASHVRREGWSMKY